MATSAEASSSSRAPADTSAHKPNDVSFATSPETDATRENTVDAGLRDEDAATGSPDNSHPSEVKRNHLIQRIKAWSPALVLENSGSVGGCHSAGVVGRETCTGIDKLIIICKSFGAFTSAEILHIARDHLASERTWLAYIRTSLAISSSGVALVQLFTIAANRSASDPNAGGSFSGTIQRYARPLGAATVLIGLGVCLLGLYRYFLIQSSLTQGKFVTARVEVHTVSLLLGALTGVVFGVLVAFPR